MLLKLNLPVNPSPIEVDAKSGRSWLELEGDRYMSPSSFIPNKFKAE